VNDTSTALPVVRRGFVDVREGQIHYRTAGAALPGRLPLIMLHAQPGSSRGLEPIMRQMARERQVFGFDTLGSGDSSAPLMDTPDIAYLAEGVLQAMNGLGIPKADLYGTHTGASLAVELSINHPDRVRRLVLNGKTLFPEEEKRENLQKYAPVMPIGEYGEHLIWTWNFMRSVFLFYPRNKQDGEHRRVITPPSKEHLHDRVVEILKSFRTYRLAYNAAYSYDSRGQLPKVTVPTFVTCPREDHLYEYVDEIARLVPASVRGEVPNPSAPGGLEATARVFGDFLNQD
jgi:pimeloyl-ACP methyl ester carboxylesterase